MDKWITRKSNENRDADCDENNNDDEGVQNEAPAKRKKYDINFRKEWKLSHPWLEEDQNIKQGKKCLICSVPIYGNLSHIVRHANSDLHKKKADIAKSTLKITNYAQLNCEEMRLSNSAKELEIRSYRFAAYFKTKITY